MVTVYILAHAADNLEEASKNESTFDDRNPIMVKITCIRSKFHLQ